MGPKLLGGQVNVKAYKRSNGSTIPYKLIYIQFRPVQETKMLLYLRDIVVDPFRANSSENHTKLEEIVGKLL